MFYQHFNTTKSSKLVAQCSVCAATSVAKQPGVRLVHEKAFRDFGSGFFIFWCSYVGQKLNIINFFKFYPK
jgi:hypothetical protein